MTFKNKTKQKYTKKRPRYRLKGGDDWYCRCTDTTISTPSSTPTPTPKPTPKPTPPPSQFASAKKALADAEKAKKAEVKPTTSKLAPPPKVTPPPTPKPPSPPSKPSNPSPCKPFKIQFPKGSKSFQKVEDLIAQGMSAKDACEKIKKENQELDKQNKQRSKGKKGGYKSKKRSPTKKKKSRKPMLVIF